MVVDRWARKAEASRIVQWVPQLLRHPCLQSDGIAALSVVVPSE
jgi:hypothetical protein